MAEADKMCDSDKSGNYVLQRGYLKATITRLYKDVQDGNLDTQSSHAYQLERDAKEDPTVTQFLGFLEKRALAMENAGSPSTTTKAINAVTREKRGCIYCAASGGGEQQDAELCCLRSLRGPAAAHAVSASPAAVV
ncbi:uncharacterized protein LOC126381114 [Pectinophora gossypiella]|uniref:uncharacterized protein LOC126381114 n=1 Tax=Pectinophora gossypiella TaxID=13191 RepID=UPI00214F1D0C|nr:uncharacterized protein LOC126381114 [Pectinophora gossypiella]